MYVVTAMLVEYCEKRIVRVEQAVREDTWWSISGTVAEGGTSGSVTADACEHVVWKRSSGGDEAEECLQDIVHLSIGGGRPEEAQEGYNDPSGPSLTLFGRLVVPHPWARHQSSA